MKRIDLLMTDVRELTDTKDVNSIKDYELLRYFNDGQKAVQNVIYQSNSSADIFVREFLKTLVSGTQKYALPTDIYAQNSVTGVFLVSQGVRHQTLRRSNFSERDSSFGYALQGKNIYLMADPRVWGTQQMLITYNYQLPTLSLRLGKIQSFDSGLNTITLQAGYNTDFATRYEYVSVVDAQGNLIMDFDSDGNSVPKSLLIDSFNSGTGVLTLSSGSFTDIANGQYLVGGRHSTTHSLLPDECEPFLLSYVQRRVLAKISSQEITTEAAFTSEEFQAIQTLFEDNVKDALYPVAQDMDFLGY